MPDGVSGIPTIKSDPVTDPTTGVVTGNLSGDGSTSNNFIFDSVELFDSPDQNNSVQVLPNVPGLTINFDGSFSFDPQDQGFNEEYMHLYCKRSSMRALLPFM